MIIDAIPFQEAAYEVSGPKGPVKIFPYQVVLSINLLIQGNRSRIFPAVIDTGFNRHFGISEELLRDWLQIEPEDLPLSGIYRLAGVRYDERLADIEIHRNLKGTYALEGEPVQLPLGKHGGISMLPKRYRLPLIGMATLIRFNLKLVVDGRTRTASLIEST